MRIDGDAARRAILMAYLDGRNEHRLDRAEWTLHELSGMLALLHAAPDSGEKRWLIRLAEMAFDSLSKRINRRRNEC